MLVILNGQLTEKRDNVSVLFSAREDPSHQELQRLLGPYAKVATMKDERISPAAVRMALQFADSVGYSQIVVHGHVARTCVGMGQGWSVAAGVLKTLFPDRDVELGELIAGPRGLEIGMTLSIKPVMPEAAPSSEVPIGSGPEGLKD